MCECADVMCADVMCSLGQHRLLTKLRDARTYERMYTPIHTHASLHQSHITHAFTHTITHTTSHIHHYITHIDLFLSFPFLSHYSSFYFFNSANLDAGIFKSDNLLPGTSPKFNVRFYRTLSDCCVRHLCQLSLHTHEYVSNVFLKHTITHFSP